MLLQIQDCQRGLTIKEGVSKMAAEGAVLQPYSLQQARLLQRGALTPSACCSASDHLLAPLHVGTIRAFFKGNGTNVVKIAPETAIKLTLNDALKRARS